MQSNKASKKTSTLAEESLSPVDSTLNAEGKAKPRAAKSSKPKSESGDTAAAKRHRKAQPAVPAEETPTALSDEKAYEVSEQNASYALPVSEPQSESSGTVASTESAASAQTVYSEEDVRNLAYHFWVERGMPHGSDHEDWARAERALAAGA